MKTRTRGGTILAAATAALLVLSTPALAAGPGGGGGGGAGGGGDTTTGALYSDLVIALRDANGAPILKKYVVPATDETDETTEYCVQPVSYEAVPGVTSSINPVDGRTVWVLPLQGQWIGSTEELPVEEIEACDPWPQYAMFVSEVEMERLNLARTSEAVIARKISDVELKLQFADKISLESTGRINYDGLTIDAAPENAGMYQSLMKTGTIPGLPNSSTTVSGPPAEIGPAGVHSRFDAWELAAMTIGAAASKFTPLTIDAVEYYNRVIGFPPADYVPTAEWPVEFNRSLDPITGLEMTTGEQFVDYSEFEYNRSETFNGSVTWLDVPTLTWKVTKIIDLVPFTDLASEDATQPLKGVKAFAQLADDVRALCNFVPDNTFLPGFYMDVPGVDTTTAQQAAITHPAVDLGALPANVFETYAFPVETSLLNPWGGAQINEAMLRITIDTPDALAALDVTAIRTPSDQSSENLFSFSPDTAGNLVGTWVPDGGPVIDPGYNVSTLFDFTVADTSTVEPYQMKITLDLIGAFVATDSATVLASETSTITVNPNKATVLWGDSVPKLATQGVSMTLPLQVYSPAPDDGQLSPDDGKLLLTVAGPGDDQATTEDESLAAGDVKIYASDGTDMVAMPLTSNAANTLQGTWTAALSAGYTPVTWYVTVGEGSPVGNYTFDVSLEGGNDLAGALLVAVSAPDAHGEQPPGSGEDTTAPDVTIVAVDTALSATVAFDLTASEDGVAFTCMLTKTGVTISSGSCKSTVAYTDLEPGTYIFTATATDLAGNVGEEDFLVVIRAAAAPPATSEPPAVAAPAPAPPASGAPTTHAPPATTPVVPTAVVTAKATNKRTKLFVNVNPNKGSGYWNIKVYRQVVKGDKVSWEKVGKTLRTRTSKETRTINLGEGTYRVKVMEKYGMKGDVSQQVTLVR